MKNRKFWQTSTIILAIALLIFIYYNPFQKDSYAVKELPEEPEYVDVNIGENKPQLGDNDAPVTIVEFSDYECGYCALFTIQNFLRLKQDFIDTGKVKFIHKHFPLEKGHQFSFKAAEAALCAQKQGKFWEYHELLFKNMNELEIEDLKKYAEQLNLDMEEFNACLDSGEMEDEVRKDLADGQAAGVTGTPFFFINGRKVIGFKKYKTFSQIIEEEIARV